MKVGQFVKARPRSNYKFANEISCTDQSTAKL